MFGAMLMALQAETLSRFKMNAFHLVIRHIRQHYIVTPWPLCLVVDGVRFHLLIPHLRGTEWCN
jgi:hypothetical protein